MTTWGIKAAVAFAATAAIFAFVFNIDGQLHFKGFSVAALSLSLLALAAAGASHISRRHPRTEPDEYDQW